MIDRIRKVVPRPVKDRVRSSLLTLNRYAGIEVASPPPVAAADPRSGESTGPADTSQHGEATFLESLVSGDGFPPYLVDVGAYDGETISTSRPFVLRGWHALLVEPHPVQFAKLAARYEGWPHVRCVNKACADQPGTRPLFLGTGGPETTTSTLNTDDNRWYAATRTGESVPVDVDLLTNLLAESAYPPDFSLLLVDAEGMDYEVLNGLDFERFRPRIVVTEEYISDPEKHNAKYRLLLDRGYTFVTLMGCNTIWLRTELVASALKL